MIEQMRAAATRAHIAAFNIEGAGQILVSVRICIALIILVWVTVGPLPNFYPEEEALLYAPSGIAVLFPPLGPGGFFTFKAMVAIGCFGMMVPAFASVSTRATAVTFAILNGYLSGFGDLWNYNTHLNIFLVALAFVPSPNACGGGLSNAMEERQSAILFFMRFQVSVIYFQAGLAKLIHGGVFWPLHTPSLHLALQGGATASWLLAWPVLLTGFGYLVIGVELALFILFLVKRTQPFAVIIAISLHLAFFFGLGIGFWHLWALYPALFLFRPSRVREGQHVNRRLLARIWPPLNSTLHKSE